MVPFYVFIDQAPGETFELTANKRAEGENSAHTSRHFKHLLNIRVREKNVMIISHATLCFKSAGC